MPDPIPGQTPDEETTPPEENSQPEDTREKSAERTPQEVYQEYVREAEKENGPDLAEWAEGWARSYMLNHGINGTLEDYARGNIGPLGNLFDQKIGFLEASSLSPEEKIQLWGKRLKEHAEFLEKYAGERLERFERVPQFHRENPHHGGHLYPSTLSHYKEVEEGPIIEMFEESFKHKRDARILYSEPVTEEVEAEEKRKFDIMIERTKKVLT